MLQKNITRNLSPVDRWEQERQTLELEARRAKIAAILQKSKKPFRVLPEVEKWQAQYKDLRDRYRFLTLSGGSCLGKTQFALSLCPPGMETLELNMASSPEPDLREFVHGRHGLVLFDEMHPSVCLKQKKAFQAGLAMVQLGCSTTNCYSYSKCLFGARLVVCNNSWSQDLQKMPPHDREWILDNSVHIEVTKPLYQTAEADQ